jgi:hypothetical protein
MKNIILTSALILVFALAALGASPATGNNGVREKIQKEITYPDFAKETNEMGFVLVGFTLDSVGQIQVSGINTDNPLLGEYVVNKIQEIRFDEMENASGEYAIRIDFELM